MAKLKIAYKVQGANEIKEITKSLVALEKSIVRLNKKGIHLNIIINGKKTKRL